MSETYQTDRTPITVGERHYFEQYIWPQIICNIVSLEGQEHLAKNKDFAHVVAWQAYRMAIRHMRQKGRPAIYERN